MRDAPLENLKLSRQILHMGISSETAAGVCLGSMLVLVGADGASTAWLVGADGASTA